MSQFQENIHIAILGPVSAGKSTLLNGLFATTYSQMKKKRTTMMPNIYQTTFNEKEVDSFESIQKKNADSNEEIFKLRESGKYNQTHFKEINHKVKPIDDFITLPDENAIYKINDLPGINDQDAQIYYDYVKNNSHNIDIYLLVFDINSPLNRTDEVKILQEVTNHVKSNKNSYVHILINKCDDITFDDKDNFKFDDEENQESYDECVKTITKFMKDIMNKVTISPLRSQLLYTYRTAIGNMDKLEEKQIDNIIKEEAGKVELAKLKTEETKKKYLKGMIADKKLKLKDTWMKSTGYDLFQKHIVKIMNNYQQIILYHIEQDIDKILADTKKTQIGFDLIVSELEIINQRFRNLVATYNNKCKVDEIIPETIKTKLNEITQLMNNYLVSGINTYTGNTRENAESFITKIQKFFTKVSNLFKSNPLATSEEKLKLKRIELINNNLAEKYNADDFTELYTTKNIDLIKYTQSIANTLDKNLMSFDKLLGSVKKITNSDEKFINVIINKFTSSYKADTTIDEFLKNLELIANTTNNNIDVIWSIIECQFKNVDSATFEVYKNWIDLNSSNIVAQSDEVKFIMFKIKKLIKINSQPQITADFGKFKDETKKIESIYMLVVGLVGNKSVDNFSVCYDNKKTEKQITKQSRKQLEPEETEFEDCADTVHEKSDTEKSDEYNDSDDSDTVFRKATKNTSIRTTKRVNKGAKVASVTK